MKASEALRKAEPARRARARRTSIAYICNGLHTAAEHGRITGEARDRVVYRIEELLGRYESLGGWLLANVPGAYALRDTAPAEFRARVEATRRAWVKWLIADFESKGD